MQWRWLTLLSICVLPTASLAEDASWVNPMPYPALPEAISSFGAAADGEHIYVFSGHIGRIPGNSSTGLSPHFARLKLSDPQAKWESLAMHQPSQSPGLVAWKGAIYRVGGLSFTNGEGEDTAFNSLATFAKYNPSTNKWKELPPLPEPRSSHDAAVVGDKLYVVGGWNLQGSSSMGAPWHDQALVFDLTKEDGQWQKIAEPPFQTRAVAAIGHAGKLWVLGGMQSTNATTREVHIYDPAANTWSKGPDVAGRDGLAGFAISAVSANGKLYFNGSEGIIYALKEDGLGWEPVQRLLIPRSFHRLLPAGEQGLIAIAGVARGGGYLGNVEVVKTRGEKSPPKFAQWSVPFAGKAKHSQILLLQGNSLYAFGGNNSPGPHDFAKEAFNNEAFRFDLTARSVEKLPNLPAGVQSGGAFAGGARGDQTIFVVGGIGFVGEEHRSLDTIYQYKVRSKDWSEDVLKLPGSRAMFSTASQAGTLWIFGGAEVNGKGLIADTWQWKPASEEPAAVLPGAALATARRSFGGATIGNKFYAVGGLGENADIVESAAVFDLTTGKWEGMVAPKLPRVFPNLVAVAGKLVLAGGFAKVDGHFSPGASMEIYDPATNAWETVPGEFGLKGRQLLEYQGRLMFFGIDAEKEGIAQFGLLDLTPESTYVAASPAFAARDTASESATELLTRLLKLDKNKDGQLTKDEVGERFQPIIEKADTNADGVATKEEIEAYVKKAGPSPMTRPR